MHFAYLFAALVNLSATMARKSDYASDCGFDIETGLPDGWKSTEISLDIVIVLDTSEAMGEVALTDATIMIDSLIGSADEDFLNTDTSADNFVRIGLVAVADHVQVLHNLNMTKADTVQGKVSVSTGVSEMDFEKAFEAARAMFSDGERPERANTRKVIYIITYSEAKPLLRIAEDFKLSDGIVIVNQFVFEYADELPVLEQLASDGYYYADANDDLMLIIQLFCKAANLRTGDIEDWRSPLFPALLSSSLMDTIRRIWRLFD